MYHGFRKSITWQTVWDAIHVKSLASFRA